MYENKIVSILLYTHKKMFIHYIIYVLC